VTIKKTQCEITGTSPLLMHRFPMESIVALEIKSREEQAEISAYRDPDTRELYIPGVAFQRCLVAAAVYSKGKGRASLGVEEYAIDSRPVIISATKGRIIRHRSRLNEWRTTFIIEYDDELITEERLRRVVDDAGSRVGLLDFRPERKGPFGRFMVALWKRI
jgi:hypothetical protein